MVPAFNPLTVFVVNALPEATGLWSARALSVYTLLAVPQRKRTVVLEPPELTEPLSTAPVCPMSVAAVVVAVGAEGVLGPLAAISPLWLGRRPAKGRDGSYCKWLVYG